MTDFIQTITNMRFAALVSLDKAENNNAAYVNHNKVFNMYKENLRGRIDAFNDILIEISSTGTASPCPLMQTILKPINK